MRVDFIDKTTIVNRPLIQSSIIRLTYAIFDVNIVFICTKIVISRSGVARPNPAEPEMNIEY